MGVCVRFCAGSPGPGRRQVPDQGGGKLTPLLTTQLKYFPPSSPGLCLHIEAHLRRAEVETDLEGKRKEDRRGKLEKWAWKWTSRVAKSKRFPQTKAVLARPQNILLNEVLLIQLKGWGPTHLVAIALSRPAAAALLNVPAPASA